MEQPPPCWNLFVAILLDLLQRRNADLDTARYRAKLAPEKVRRLKESIDYQGKFPVLNPQEMAQIKAAFHLTDEEEQQLLAATLATAIEAKLVPRIRAKAALQAAWTMFPILVTALQQAEQDEENPLLTIRQGGNVDEPPLIERQFAEAIEAIDAGMLAYYLGRQAHDDRDRASSAAEARQAFTHALQVLERADATTRSDAIWQQWHDEASAGLREVDALI